MHYSLPFYSSNHIFFKLSTEWVGTDFSDLLHKTDGGISISSYNNSIVYMYSLSQEPDSPGQAESYHILSTT